MEVKNAVITGTNLGVQYTDHGILSFYIFLDYGGSGQGFGGLVLDDVNPEYVNWLDNNSDDRPKEIRIPTILASSLLLGIDSVFKCDWEKLKGISCRAYCVNGKVMGIGNYLQDKWLWYADFEFKVGPFKELEEIKE